MDTLQQNGEQNKASISLSLGQIMVSGRGLVLLWLTSVIGYSFWVLFSISMLVQVQSAIKLRRQRKHLQSSLFCLCGLYCIFKYQMDMMHTQQNCIRLPAYI